MRAALTVLLLAAVLIPIAAGQESCESLDGSEAHICGVDWLPDGDDTLFYVTIYDANNDTYGYADWWQVETRNGNVLGRHDLDQRTTNDPFTTNDTFTIPDDVDEVVVRAHDSQNGFGGRTAIVGFLGTQEAVDQGAEPDDFSTGEETSSGDDGSGSSTEDESGGALGGLGGNTSNDETITKQVASTVAGLGGTVAGIVPGIDAPTGNSADDDQQGSDRWALLIGAATIILVAAGSILGLVALRRRQS